MYKYYIKIYLSSGDKIYGTYEGTETTTTQVCKKLFVSTSNKIDAIESMTGGNLFYSTDNVAAFEIDIKEIL